MNLSTIVLTFCGCLAYISAMSALGRWLAGCREDTSIVYIAGQAQSRLGA